MGLASVGIYFLIENGNAVDNVFVFRWAFMNLPWAVVGQPKSVSGSLGCVYVPR